MSRFLHVSLAVLRLQLARNLASGLNDAFYATVLPLLVYALLRAASPADRDEVVLVTGAIMLSATPKIEVCTKAGW